MKYLVTVLLLVSAVLSSRVPPPPDQLPILANSLDVKATNGTGYHHASSGKRYAVVALLSTDGYYEPLGVLAESLRKVHTKADLVLAYIPQHASEYSLCMARANGWITRPVKRLEPVISEKGRPGTFRFFWLYTKLRLFNWTDYDAIVYLDIDTLAIRNFDELFTLPVNFAGVLDAWDDGHCDTNINAGMMLIKPNATEYNRLIEGMETKKDKYDLTMAEQNYLSYQYYANSFRLPFKYNVNLALKHHDHIWELVWPEAKIVHYTIVKPFQGDERNNEFYSEPIKAWFEVFDAVAADQKRQEQLATCSEENREPPPHNYEYPNLW